MIHLLSLCTALTHINGKSGLRLAAMNTKIQMALITVESIKIRRPLWEFFLLLLDTEIQHLMCSKISLAGAQLFAIPFVVTVKKLHQ